MLDHIFSEQFFIFSFFILWIGSCAFTFFFCTSIYYSIIFPSHFVDQLFFILVINLVIIIIIGIYILFELVIHSFQASIGEIFHVIVKLKFVILSLIILGHFWTFYLFTIIILNQYLSIEREYRVFISQYNDQIENDSFTNWGSLLVKFEFDNKCCGFNGQNDYRLESIPSSCCGQLKMNSICSKDDLVFPVCFVHFCDY